MTCLKTSRILLPSDTRDESVASLLQQDVCAQAARLYLNVTDASGSGGLQVVFRGYDKISGNAVEITPGGALVNAVGTYVYEINNYPADDAFGNIMVSAARSLPYQWDAFVKHSDGSQYTYSLSVELVG